MAKSSGDLRLLSLDGGGVRGLSSLQILKQLMLQINSNSPPKPCDYFDMIGGTSTGGVFAKLFQASGHHAGSASHDVDECIEAYTSLADSVFTKKHSALSLTLRFQGRYDSDNFVKSIQDIIVKAGLNKDELFWEPDLNACRVFVCATSAETSDTVHLTSFKAPRARDDLLKSAKIWEVARATSAATSFFDAIKIGSHGTRFLDGGTGANNPVYEMWMLARDEFYPNDGEDQLEKRISCLVSIGTGVPSPKAFGNSPDKVGKALIAMVTETEKIARKFNREKMQMNGRYFRFNVPSGLDDFAMEDAKNKSKIIAVTDRYLEDEDTFLKVKVCGELLAGKENIQKLLAEVMNISWAESRVVNPLSLNSRVQSVRIDWLLESPEYQQFTHDTTTILWYSGPPATSKSALLLRIVRERRNEMQSRTDLAVGYYHVPYSNSDYEHTPVAIFRRLIGQLLIRAVFCRTLEARGAGNNNINRNWSYIQSLPPNIQKFPDSLRLLFTEFSHEWRTVFSFCDNNTSQSHSAMLLLLNLLLTLKGWDTLLAIDGIDQMNAYFRKTFLDLLLEMLHRLRADQICVRILVASRPYDDIREILRGVPVIVRDSEYKGCLTSLHFDEMHFRRNEVDAPQVGTYGWIWNHPAYKKWFECEGTDESSVLWIKGKAGSGKSTLARMVQTSLSTNSSQSRPPSTTASPEIDLSEDINVPDESSVSNDIVADFFYSGRAGTRAKSPRWMLQSLLHQALKQDPSSFNKVRPYYRQFLNDFETPGWPYELLKTALAAIATSISQDRPSIPPRMYILVDAADESQKESEVERIDIINFLVNLCSEMASSGRVIKVLLVSRAANDIQVSLSGVNTIEMHQQTAKDVEKIVQEGIILLGGTSGSLSGSEEDSDDERGMEELQPWRNRLPNKGGSISKVGSWRPAQIGSQRSDVGDDLELVHGYLVRNADGVILWVVLILKELRRALERGFWTLNNIRELLTSLPKDLEHCYIEMIRRIKETGMRDQESYNISLLQRCAVTLSVLSWAAFSIRALTLAEFREILAVREIVLLRALPQQESSVPKARDTSLSANRIWNTSQVRNALLYYCDGFLESANIPARERLRRKNPKRSVSASDVVQLLHRSAKDFLLMNRDAMPFHLNLEKGSRDIVQSSLEYLKLSLPAPHVPADGHSWSDEDYNTFCEHLKDRPRMGYILSAVKEHLRNCRESDSLLLVQEYFLSLHESPTSHAWEFLEGWIACNEMLPHLEQTSSAQVFRQNCLRNAARMRGSDVVKLLLETKVTDVSEALSTATRMRNTEMVKILLYQGPMINIPGLNEALFQASGNGYADIVSIILGARHIQPDARYPSSKNSSMHLAAKGGHESVLRLLLGAGCDIEAENNEKNTPLHIACHHGHTSSVNLLLHHGANITPRNNANSTPLMLATGDSYKSIVESLLKRYKHLDEMDVSGATFTFQTDGDEALHIARNSSPAIKALLLDAKTRGLSRQEALSLTGQAKETATGAQNRNIRRLLGGTTNARDSLRLLSFADSSFEGMDRNSSRHSHAFLAPDDSYSRPHSDISFESTSPGIARPDSPTQLLLE